MLSVNIKIEAGFVENDEKVYIMPNADPVIIKGIIIFRFIFAFVTEKTRNALVLISLHDD